VLNFTFEKFEKKLFYAPDIDLEIFLKSLRKNFEEISKIFQGCIFQKFSETFFIFNHINEKNSQITFWKKKKILLLH